jgi:hypothetical protein
VADPERLKSTGGVSAGGFVDLARRSYRRKPVTLSLLGTVVLVRPVLSDSLVYDVISKPTVRRGLLANLRGPYEMYTPGTGGHIKAYRYALEVWLLDLPRGRIIGHRRFDPEPWPETVATLTRESEPVVRLVGRAGMDRWLAGMVLAADRSPARGRQGE